MMTYFYKELLKKENIDISDRHYDRGMLIYDLEKQAVHVGGSGCGCSAVVLSSYILRKIDNGDWKRVLFVPTGALLNKTTFNEGQNVPGIAHGVVIEVIEWFYVIIQFDIKLKKYFLK